MIREAAQRLLLAAAIALCVMPRAAWADGAFPGEMAVLLPPDQPNLFYVDSNFGLLLSENGGVDWYYVCEALVSPDGANVLHYLLASDGTLFAVSAGQFSHSENGGVSWTLGAGTIDNQGLLDAFADPNDSQSVVVIGTAGSNATAIYQSSDGGKTFDAPLLTDPGQLLSVEISRSTPGLIYATAWEQSGASGQALIYSSTDHGSTWTKTPVTDSTYANLALLIAEVDPIDGKTIYFRATEPPGITAQQDFLVVTNDGGATLTESLNLQQPMGAFAKGSDGTLYVGGSGSAGGLWVMAPMAASWTTVMTPPITCLGIRGDTLYACSQGINGTFALGATTNGGQAFTSLFDFSNIIGPVPCDPVKSGCAVSWQILIGMFGTYIGTNPPAAPPAVTCPQVTTQPTKKGCSCAGTADVPALLLVPGLIRYRRRSRK